MARPPLEVADLVRCARRRFIDNNRHWLNRLHLKVLTAIERCRTAAPGAMSINARPAAIRPSSNAFSRIALR